MRAAPPPGPVVGASTGAAAVGATTGVLAAGATTGARVGGTTGASVGATTGAKAPAPSRPTVTRIAPSATALRTAARATASKCPVSSRPDTAFSVLVDSVGPQKPAAKLTVNYDVCRLAQSSPFSAKFTLRKLNQRGIGRQPPRTAENLEIAAGPRSRHRYVLDLAGLSAGRYALDVIVRNNVRDVGVTREFQLLER